MRSTTRTILWLALAAALATSAACEDTKRAGVSTKVVERADKAAERTHQRVSAEATRDIHDVTVEELDHRLYSTDDPTPADTSVGKLRNDIDAIRSAQSDYTAARDRVVVRARAHVASVWSQAHDSALTKTDSEQAELDRLHRRAIDEIDNLAIASADEWDEDSERTFEAVEALDRRVDQMARGDRGGHPRGDHGLSDPDQRNAPLRP